MSHKKSAITFPDRILSELEIISNLSEKELDQIIEFYNSEGFKSLSCTSFVENFENTKIDISTDNIHDIFHFINSSFKQYNEIINDKDLFFSNLKEFIIKNNESSRMFHKMIDEKTDENDKDLKKLIDDFSEIDPQKVENFLKKIYEVPSIPMMSKGLEIIRGNTKSYINQTAKIFTDIRPIFEDLPDSKIKDNINFASIIHNLKMEFVENDIRKEFIISLSSEDLHELKKVIERAVYKDKLCKKFLTNNDTQFLAF